ncbi:Ig family protein [Candidatus Magnetomorum sp. HK-1]|nr:Ig family protein [Candidatus Magnetomorum sp. HK-1]
MKTRNIGTVLISILILLIITPNLYASATRTIVTDTCTTSVTIQTQFNIHIGSYAIKEILPYGLYPYNIQQNGIWDKTDRSIIWGAFPDKNDREFSYNVSGEETTQTISGLISIDGVSQAIDGDQLLTPKYCDLSFLSESIASGQLDTTYYQQILIEGGYYPLFFSIEDGDLPSGLELDSNTGTITGIPTQTGIYLFTLLVTDDQDIQVQKKFSIEITDQLIFDSNSLFSVSENSTSLLEISVSGGKQPYSISLIDGSLPDGITLEPDGKLVGKFTTSEKFEFLVNVTDAYDNSVDQTFTIHVYDPVTFGSATRNIDIQECISRISIQTHMPLLQGSYAVMELLPDGVLPYSISHNGIWDTEDRSIIWGAYADFDNRTFSYNVSGDAQESTLDGRISINGISLQISGNQQIVLQSSIFCMFNFTTETRLLPAQIEKPYIYQIVMEGGKRPFLFSLINNSSLPPGLTLDEVSGLISGIPSQTGTFVFDIECEDQLAPYKPNSSFTLEISDPLAFATNEMLDHATKGTSNQWNIIVQGGKPPYHYSLKWNQLPPGIQINENIISGIPEETGEYDFTIQVIDDNNNHIDRQFNLLVCEPLIIETQRLGDAIVGEPYTNTTLKASGGFGQYQWMIYSGQLPGGLKLNPSGEIIGISEQTIYNTLVIAVIDEDNRKTYKDYTFQSATPLDFVNETLPNALQNETYSEMIRVSGGIGPYTYVTGRLPNGLELETNTGKVFGKSQDKRTYYFNVQVTDSTWPNPKQISNMFQLTTTADLTIITEAVLPHARRGKEINPFNLVAGGGPSPYRWEVTGNQLPRGILLEPNSGRLSGAPVDRGDIVMTFQVTDNTGNTSEKEFIWHIYDTLTIQTGFLPDAAVGADYLFSIQIDGGLPPYQWREKGTVMPSGLALNPETGTIYGKPENQIAQTIKLEVSDSDAPPQIVSKEFHLSVNPDALYIFTPEIPDSPMNKPYFAEIVALLGKPSYEWRLKSGTLPPGLSLVFSPNTLKLEGTPTESGEYAITFSVSDSSSPKTTAEKTFQIEILGALEITTHQLPQASKGETYAFAIQVRGGEPPYNWQIKEGDNLPLGLSLSAISGDITGVPDIQYSESEEFIVEVLDSAVPPIVTERTFTLYVKKSVEIITENIPNALQYGRYRAIIDVEGGIQPYHFDIAQDSSFPEGLSLNRLYGILSGFPQESGNFSFTIKLSDSSTPAVIRNKVFHMTIFPGTPPEIVGGDLNGNEMIQIEDAIIALQVLSNYPGIPVFMAADINQNDRIDLGDVLHILYDISKD